MADTIESLIATLRRWLPPIHREGYPFIALFLGLTVFFLWLSWNVAFTLLLALTLWCVAFFRDPPRHTPLGDDLVISPADGTVCAIDEVAPPPELNMQAVVMQRIGIFMNVFDGHVNRAPVPGRVVRIAYTPGLFLNADLDKASEDNERNGLVIASMSREIGVVQIAGLIARRIVCFVKEGDDLQAGQRFGLIRFGSRVDVYLPRGVVARVAVGQKTIAGETVLASFSAGAALQFRQD